MKTKSWFNLLFLLLCSIHLISCNSYLLSEKDREKEEEVEWYDSISNGVSFLQGNTLRFYYIDKNGNDLINLNNPATFPVSWWEDLDNPIEHTKDFSINQFFYNSSHNSIDYDAEEGLYYCTITAYGDEKQNTYSFPVHVNGSIDRMNITYKYTNDIFSSASPVYHKIVCWEYNGTYIYSDDDEYEYGKKVFIKKYDGKTIVSLSR